MTEPRTSRRVARVVLLVLVLGLVAVALPTAPAVWEWAYGEWKPIWKFQSDPGSGSFTIISHFTTSFQLYPVPRSIRIAQSLDSGIVSYFKRKQKHLRWLPGKDLLIRQIGKEEFQRLFPNVLRIVGQEYLRSKRLAG